MLGSNKISSEQSKAKIHSLLSVNSENESAKHTINPEELIKKIQDQFEEIKNANAILKETISSLEEQAKTLTENQQKEKKDLSDLIEFQKQQISEEKKAHEKRKELFEQKKIFSESKLELSNIKNFEIPSFIKQMSCKYWSLRTVNYLSEEYDGKQRELIQRVNNMISKVLVLKLEVILTNLEKIKTV